MNGIPTLAGLYAEVQVLAERVNNLTTSLNEKHSENRGDIHAMRVDIQRVEHQIWLIKIKLAAYAAGGGLVGAGGVTGFLKLVEHFSK